MPFSELLEKIAEDIRKLGPNTSQKRILFVLRKYLFPYPDKPVDTFLDKFGDNYEK